MQQRKGQQQDQRQLPYSRDLFPGKLLHSQHYQTKTVIVANDKGEPQCTMTLYGHTMQHVIKRAKGLCPEAKVYPLNLQPTQGHKKNGTPTRHSRKMATKQELKVA